MPKTKAAPAAEEKKFKPPSVRVGEVVMCRMYPSDSAAFPGIVLTSNNSTVTVHSLAPRAGGGIVGRVACRHRDDPFLRKPENSMLSQTNWEKSPQGRLLDKLAELEDSIPELRALAL